VCWDFELCEGQKATVMDILSWEKQKRMLKVNYRTLRAIGKKDLCFCYFIKNIPKFI
jgi:hypothetical protein